MIQPLSASRACVLLYCVSFGSLALGQDSGDEPCRVSISAKLTDNFYYSASSAQGAVGDIVAVDLSLTVDGWLPERIFGLEAVCCFEGDKIELVGGPLFSEYYDQLAYMTFAANAAGGANPGEDLPWHVRGESGFLLAAALASDAAEELLQGGNPIPLVTLFFRLKGTPGDTVDIRFCDWEFVLEGHVCAANVLEYEARGQIPSSVRALSQRHEPGLIRILPGEATQTEIPELPPRARVYPELPTAETTDVLFEVAGAVARPGAKEVPLRLYITSSHEFTSYSMSLTFPPALASIARVEEAIRPGKTAIDNEKGSLGLLLYDAARRIGREDERVHVATVYVDVSETAEVEEIPFRFERAGNFIEWIGIRHTQGVTADQLPIVAEVAPIQLQTGLLAIQVRATSPGDANLDYTLNLTDAISILGHLFLGEGEVVCPPAADVNEDGRINVTDAIDILHRLFSGSGSTDTREIFCDSGAQVFAGE